MNIEQQKVAEYMAEGNNFYAPYYRHISLDSWATLNEDTISRRAQISMGDV
jgi:TRAP-type C4-dicarboxylate transport system substrate-binding protein